MNDNGRYSDFIADMVLEMVRVGKHVSTEFLQEDGHEGIVSADPVAWCRQFKTVRFSMSRFSGHQEAVPTICSGLENGELPVLVVTPNIRSQGRVKAYGSLLSEKPPMTVVSGMAECRDHSCGNRFSSVIIMDPSYLDPSYLDEIYEMQKHNAEDENFFFIHLG